MRIVFFGTPEYVIPVLEALHKSFKSQSGGSAIVAVVTQPPKPTGRRQQLRYSAVDTWAHKKGVPIYFDAEKLISDAVEAELGVVASYGKIIPGSVINYFAAGIINIHFSLLPELRGAAPIPATIILGKEKAGVSIFKLDELLDHGPIISQFTEEVLPDDTTGELMIRLSERTADVLKTLIPAYMQGKITLREQDHSKATFTKIIKKENAFVPPKYLDSALQGEALQDKWIKWKKWKINFIKDYSLVPNAFSLERFIRAMQPWPAAWTKIKIKDQEFRMKILKAHIKSLPSTGYQLQAAKLVLDEVQLEGKTPVSWEQLKQGYPEARFT